MTVRDGGSTALYTAYTIYAVQTALHCLNSSMNAYIYCWEGFNAIGMGGWASEQIMEVYELSGMDVLLGKK